MSGFATPPGIPPDAPGGVFGDPEAFLRSARSRIEAFHQGPDVSGSRITQLYSAAVDNTLRALHARVVHEATIDPAWAEDGFCLIATGGYARRALCPASDVDLLLVTAEASEDRLRAISEQLLYPLWNHNLRVGRREGTVEQIVAAAADDLTLRMCLLDLRFIAGSRGLYARFLAAARDALHGFRDVMLADVHRLNYARFRRYGESVFLLEPHVKEGKGGLRDFHWLLWMMRLRYGLRGDYDLLLSSLVEPDHYRGLIEAYEFLLRVRIQLHAMSGRARDQLRFEAQEPVARALGFRTRGRLRAVERFMGAYYRHAYAMAHWCGLYVARTLGRHWDEPPDGEEATDTLLLGPSAPTARAGGTGPSPCGRFINRSGTIELAPDEALDLGALLPLFGFVQATGGRLHHDLIELVREASRRVSARYRRDERVGAAFRGLLEGPDVFRVLAAMHRTGFLGRLIPEFGATFCQAQHNRAHLYTVDVHCLYAVRELEALGRPEAESDAPSAARAWRATETRGPLLLAGLLHDIAKSHGAAHSRVGAEMVPGILGRLGYDEDAISRTQWLVRYHLVLSDTAYHRDLQDPGTHASLRAVIGSRARLDDLMALTWADSRATNLEGFTSWRRALLEDAYRTAVAALSGDDAAGDRTDEVVEKVAALLIGEVGRRRAPEVLDRLRDGVAADRPLYLHITPPATLATHAVLLDRLAAGEDYPSHARRPRGLGASEWTVAARDRPGLLSLLSGSLTAAGLSIVGAETHTRDDGTCVDTFRLVDGKGRAVDPVRLRRVEQTLARVHRGDVDLKELVARSLKSAAPVRAAGAVSHQRVDVRNDLSEAASVVEVVVQDRPGLVWELTRALSRFGLDVRVAKIATRMDLASDTFYVVDADGARLDDARSERLAQRLRSRFLPKPRRRGA